MNRSTDIKKAVRTIYIEQVKIYFEARLFNVRPKCLSLNSIIHRYATSDKSLA